MRGATTYYSRDKPKAEEFQSTLLMRGATMPPTSETQNPYFNPRSSCEERRALRNPRRFRLDDFNPRSSCEERLTTLI